MEIEENLKSSERYFSYVVSKCKKCESMNIVFVRSEPIFDDKIGITPSRLRDVYECRGCGNEFSSEKQIGGESQLL
jgi:ribosomal protein S27E